MFVFILDALCNGTNGLIQVQERIVLPRTHDVVTDIFDLLELLEPPYEIIGKMDWGFELLVVDFSDAVLSILLREKERGCTVVTDGQCKWFAYRGFPFGFVSGPLCLGTRCCVPHPTGAEQCITAHRKPVSRLMLTTHSYPWHP